MSPPKSNAHSVLNNVKNIVASPTLQRNSDEGKLVNGNNSGRKKLLSKTIKAEYNYIQQLFEVLDIAALNQGILGYFQTGLSSNTGLVKDCSSV